MATWRALVGLAILMLGIAFAVVGAFQYSAIYGFICVAVMVLGTGFIIWETRTNPAFNRTNFNRTNQEAS